MLIMLYRLMRCDELKLETIHFFFFLALHETIHKGSVKYIEEQKKEREKREIAET
jgi:hypothetical protein